jgi:hypothetical protein
MLNECYPSGPANVGVTSIVSVGSVTTVSKKKEFPWLFANATPFFAVN